MHNAHIHLTGKAVSLLCTGGKFMAETDANQAQETTRVQERGFYLKPTGKEKTYYMITLALENHTQGVVHSAHISCRHLR
jgi:hypothetical protein